MAELLLLRLEPGDGPLAATCMVCTPAGEPLSAPARGPLADAAPLAAGRRVVVLVPGTEVIQLEADLPALPASRLLPAVPYALEDNLAADAEALHFAVGRRMPNGRTQVAVIDRALLRGWLDALAEAGVEPQAVYSDSALVPEHPGHLVLLVEGATVAVRRPDAQALSLPAEPLSAAIDLALHDAARAAPDLDPAGALGLLAFLGHGDWWIRADELQALQPRFAAMRVEQLPDGPLPWLAPQIGTADPINLLQGAFAPRRGSGVDWKRWRLAAALVATLLLLHAGSRAWELRQLAAREQALDAQVAAALGPLQGSLPPDASTRDARRALETLLLRARGGNSDGGALLPALSAYAEARSATPEARLESIGFSGEAIELKIRAPDAEGLARIDEALKAGGWQTEILSETFSAAGHEGRIRLQSARSGDGAPT